MHPFVDYSSKMISRISVESGKFLLNVHGEIPDNRTGLSLKMNAVTAAILLFCFKYIIKSDKKSQEFPEKSLRVLSSFYKTNEMEGQDDYVEKSSGLPRSVLNRLVGEKKVDEIGKSHLDMNRELTTVPNDINSEKDIEKYLIYRMNDFFNSLENIISKYSYTYSTEFVTSKEILDLEQQFLDEIYNQNKIILVEGDEIDTIRRRRSLILFITNKLMDNITELTNQ